MLEAPSVSLLLILIIFFATLAVLKKFVFVPISTILKERENEAARSAKSFAEAQQRFDEAAAKIEADLAAARRESLRLREELRAEGIRLREEKTGEARRKAADSLTTAAAEIAGQAETASRDLPSRVAVLGRQLAEKILGRKVAA